MGDSDCRFRFIHFLTTRTTGTHGVNLQIFIPDFDINIRCFRHDCDGRGTGMNPPLGLCFGDALYAMPATFKLQLMKRRLAGDRQHDFFHSPEFVGRKFEHFEFPASLFDKFCVHVEKVSSK